MSKIQKHPACGWRTPEVWNENAWSLGAAKGNKGIWCLLQLGKSSSIAFTIHAGKVCHWAVLSLYWVKPSSGVHHATSTLAKPVMHFCVVLPWAIYSQTLIKVLLWDHLKAGSVPALKRAYFVSWLVSGSGRVGCCRTGSAWEKCWEQGQQLLQPLLLEKLLCIKTCLCTVLHFTVGSSKHFLPCGFYLTHAPWKLK